ncbi:hypothetical protein [Chthonomonas sp.]|uniref:hypothetical protein n=1 Tax=Chthonomonas sp. TaxID=2282153 RepID=UPI002B4B7881|nr:hypothetical protein [Chthonomonas sp.]
MNKLTVMKPAGHKAKRDLRWAQGDMDYFVVTFYLFGCQSSWNYYSLYVNLRLYCSFFH